MHTSQKCKYDATKNATHVWATQLLLNIYLNDAILIFLYMEF